jgi:nucleoside-diphosphate-sugar epimerase
MINKCALIGYTGFIGSNLINFKKKLIKYNSKNINKIRNKKFDILICAGTTSKIWLSNKKPLEDKRKIQNLIDNLKTIRVKKFVLISTSEVYGRKKICLETTKNLQNTNTDYGLNRLMLENFVEKKFENNFILRLPIVYGKNFSKNCIYDLINKHEIYKLNSSDLIQIYNVANLKKDINFVIKNKINKLNISSKPIKLGTLAKKFFKIKLNNKKKFRKINIKSIYGKKDGYFLSQNKTQQDFLAFLKKTKI